MSDAPANPYSDDTLRKAWANGYAMAGRRHGSRASNPHFDASSKQAWNDGFDARKVEKSRKPHRWL